MMRSFNLSLALVCICYIALASAQDSTPQHFLDAHNAARTGLGAGIPNLVWNTTLENYAQNYATAIRNANACNSQAPSGNPPIYGENVKGGAAYMTGKMAVEKWVDEEDFYTYSTNTCGTGMVCGHYTQVVWRNSVGLGCARVQCYNNAGYYVICSYYPPGNVAGQLPY